VRSELTTRRSASWINASKRCGEASTRRNRTSRLTQETDKREGIGGGMRPFGSLQSGTAVMTAAAVVRTNDGFIGNRGRRTLRLGIVGGRRCCLVAMHRGFGWPRGRRVRQRPPHAMHAFHRIRVRQSQWPECRKEHDKHQQSRAPDCSGAGSCRREFQIAGHAFLCSPFLDCKPRLVLYRPR
jgi:ssDNA-binding Zn-finger/Zn-ribbon topoisomerase 1